MSFDRLPNVNGLAPLVLLLLLLLLLMLLLPPFPLLVVRLYFFNNLLSCGYIPTICNVACKMKLDRKTKLESVLVGAMLVLSWHCALAAPTEPKATQSKYIKTAPMCLPW